jgi:hypothetical protein
MIRFASFAGLLILAAPVLAADEATYAARWQQLADISVEQVKTTEGHAYEQALGKVHNTFWIAVRDKCIESAQREDVTYFYSIVVINAAGEVTEFLPLPHSANFQCFVDNMKGKKYPEPPHSPFYEVLRVGLVQPKS